MRYNSGLVQLLDQLCSLDHSSEESSISAETEHTTKTLTSLTWPGFKVCIIIVAWCKCSLGHSSEESSISAESQSTRQRLSALAWAGFQVCVIIVAWGWCNYWTNNVV